ncbi:MAG: long-chain fatty acid--CoA ligase [Bacteroidota bacterium]
MNWTRTFDVFSYQAQVVANEKSIVYQDGKRWIKLSSQDCLDAIRCYQQKFRAWGLEKGDKFIYMPNRARVEWVLMDAAAQSMGIIVVPVHISYNLEAFRSILEESEAKVCVFLSEEEIAKFFPEGSRMGLHVHALERNGKAIFSPELLLKKRISRERMEDFSIQPEDLCSIMYTSGTTGQPKGVMLTHQNLASNVKASLIVLPELYQKRCLSFLPYSHVLERMAVYAYLASGASLYLPGENDLTKAFLHVKPQYFSAVPRILEKMVENIQHWKNQQILPVRMLVNWALKIGRRYREGAKVRPIFWFEQQVARLLVFNRFRKLTGGSLKAVFSGAAYLKPDVSRIFATAGVKIREGYGLTETSPIVTANRFSPGMFKLGTVGLPVPGVSVMIDQPNAEGEGEILVKGPNVMKGYYKRPEETAKVFTKDGWFRTGDVGKWTAKRFLQITDRKKDIFKTSAGKYIAPLALENYLQESDFIDQSMVVGFQRPFITALIRPDFDSLEAWAMDEQIHWTSPEYMILNIKIKEKISQELEKINEKLPNFQRIREFSLFHEELSPVNGLMTYTYKLNRPKILERFQKAVEEMY